MSAAALYWDYCPTDVLMSIFPLLDDTALSQCFKVNSWWRDQVDYFAKHHGKWPGLVTNLMANRGVTFRSKSLLGCRDLYLNSLLWHQVGNARLVCDCEHTLDNIDHLYVYADLLGVVYGDPLQRSQVKCFKIEDTSLKPAKKETTLSGDPERCFTPKSKNPTDDVKELIQGSCLKRIAVASIPASGGNYFFYAIDAHHVFLSWYVQSNVKWDIQRAARYYGPNDTLDKLEVVESKDVDSGKQFVGKTTHRPYYDDDDDAIPSAWPVRHEVCWVGEYPDLTSATQHGDMLFLGYEDGKIEIYKVDFENKDDPSPPKLRFNIKQYVKDGLRKEDHKVIVIEVYEAKQSHHLLIATPSKLYRLVITYPEDVISSLGLSYS